MKILIIILIATMIVQTVLFIYTNFIDLSQRRQSEEAQRALTNAHEDFCREKKRFAEIIDKRDELIKNLNTINGQYIRRIQELEKEIEHIRKTDEP